MTDGMRHLPCGKAVNSNRGVPGAGMLNSYVFFL